MMTAKEFLEEHWNGALPVDPVALANAIGVKVEAALPFDENLKGASGCVSLVNGKPRIRYCSSEPEVRQRFTIAHELGHVVLGHLSPEHALFRDGIREFSSGVQGSERAANQFAARVLMPADSVRSAVKGINGWSLTKLANKFGVSEVAMKYRLINLGLIDG